jgi:PIN domain nuclease of toxin-antitoxin system
MNVLLDTHAFLWWISDDSRLSSSARAILAESGNRTMLSAASVWEIAIKTALGRLEIDGAIETFIPQQLAANSLLALPIELSHALRVGCLPELHRDPFDRMLVAQAQIENLPILTCDPDIDRYDVETVW